MPQDLPELAKPVKVQPFFTTEFKLPRAKAGSVLTSFHQLPGSGNVFFVLHQKGIIWRVEKTATGEDKTVFADLPAEVFSERGPNGLPDLTFHPEFRENRNYYLFYQVQEEGKATTHIVEKQFDAAFIGDSGKRLFGLTLENGILKTARQIGTVPQRVVSFSEDEAGHLYATGYEGTIYQIDFTEARFE